MKNKFHLLGWLCGIALICLNACTNSDELLEANGKGSMKIALSTKTEFSSLRSADAESEFADPANYKVNIINEKGSVIENFTYKDAPDFLELTPGNYKLKAFKGEDKPASFSMYVEGSTDFTVVEGDTTAVSVVCKPVDAKVTTVWDTTMDTYFSTYNISFNTSYLETFSTLEKDQTVNPYYLKVNKDETIQVKINLTKKNGTASTVSQTFKVSPLDALTITVKPTIVTGNLGITITINDSTNDQDVIVNIPADWV